MRKSLGNTEMHLNNKAIFFRVIMYYVCTVC